MKYYFAYGSNMLREQMDHRCPQADSVCRGILRGWKFAINERGVATLRKNEDGLVHGVIYEVTSLCVQYLDIYEGVRSGAYGKFYLPVEVFRSDMLVTCLTYIDPSILNGAPRTGYLEKVVEGARDFQLPQSYINQLKKWKR